ncbi:MAG: DUF1549 and DUF1553 domain-containing protein, partial [Planctomycetaceae bacterium]
MSRRATLQLISAAIVSAMGLGVVAAIHGNEIVAEPQRAWPFQSPRRPVVPRVKHAGWLRSPVDAFVLVELEAVKLQPADEAQRRTLLRRLCFDLLGLPPTPLQIQQFLHDAEPDAYERLVERLLGSPGYGERWAQHWLDVVRYADSDGFEYDDPRPHAWRFRDWVITALNSNKPFDRFVRDQIAADELTPQDLWDLPALGLHRMGPLRKNAGVQDEQKNRQEVLTEIVDGFTSAFLGLTFGCARCHDHKFDPISQADYYSLQAFFAGTDAADYALLPTSERLRKQAALDDWKQSREVAQKDLDVALEPLRRRLLQQKRAELTEPQRRALDTELIRRTDQQKILADKAQTLLLVDDRDILAARDAAESPRIRMFQDKIKRLDDEQPEPIPTVMGVSDRGRKVPPTYILDRGDPHARLREVPPRFPMVLVAPGRSGPPLIQPRGGFAQSGEHVSSGRRAALAEWLTDRDNPLTARVFVNRVWYHHFGRGIVGTPNDFGAMGDSVSHPDLLDWLAVEFIESGWNVKHLHRLMVLSATYRQSSQSSRQKTSLAQAVDPQNLLLWRANRRRIEAEVLRDSLLVVGGGLNRAMGGPGVRLPLPPEIAALQYKGQWQPDDAPARFNQRSIYMFVKRNIQNPLLENFDAPGTL